MATSREHVGPTPSGGTKSVGYFMDDNGNPADEKVATRILITEYDSSGKVIQRTYGELEPKKPPVQRQTSITP